MSRRPLVVLGSLVAAAAAVAALGVGWVTWMPWGEPPPPSPTVAAVAIDIDLAVRHERLRAEPWRRAPLRGEARECDAAAEREAALDQLQAAHEEPRWWRFFLECEEPGPCAERADRAAAAVVELERVRASTQCAFVEIATGYQPDYPYRRCGTTAPLSLDYAQDMLLELARDEAPAACLEIVADVIRLQQDASVDSITSRSSFPGVVDELSELAVACAARATASEVWATARELDQMAAAPPPLQRTLRFYALHRAREAHALSRQESWPRLSADPYAHVSERLAHRDNQLVAQVSLDAELALRDERPLSFPADLRMTADLPRLWAVMPDETEREACMASLVATLRAVASSKGAETVELVR